MASVRKFNLDLPCLHFMSCGPIAQLAEPPAHNRSVPGSNPGGPTSYCVMKIGVKPEREFFRPVERKIWFLGGEQGSVPQSEAEIPRDSEKRVRHTGCTLFFVLKAGAKFYSLSRSGLLDLKKSWNTGGI